MVSKSITRQGRDITMINLTKLADGADNFNRFISNGTNSGHGSLPAGSNFWNFPSLAHAMTGGGHMFTKLWLLIHILAIMGLIGSVMVQIKADASDKEDWFTRGRTIGKYFYMAIIGPISLAGCVLNVPFLIHYWKLCTGINALYL